MRYAVNLTQNILYLILWGKYAIQACNNHCYADDTQLYLSFHPDDPAIAARVSACLTDIPCWMKDHHL